MRDPSLFFLYSAVTRIKGVGGSTVAALQRLLPVATVQEGSALPTVRDLLFHLPVGMVDRRFTCPLASAPEGVVATFVVTVQAHHPPARRHAKSPYKIICSNDTGDITLVYFHAQADYLKQLLPVGARRVVSGRTERFDYRLQMTHPDIVAPAEKLAEVQQPEPVYPLTAGLTSRRIEKIVGDALKQLPELPEWIDSGWLASRHWPGWKAALQQAHRPQTADELSPDSPARLRLAYDEILANQLYLAVLRSKMQHQAGEVITGTGKLTQPLLDALPFKLTAGQETVLRDIAADMASGRRMGRLLQGDVGSGKTIVALLAMLRAVEQGMQAALMVPTEIIAQQHYDTLSKMLALLQFPPPLRGRVREGGAIRGYEDHTLDHARQLRKQLTDAEKKLWSHLRGRQCEGHKFRRQQPIGPYIADFFCPEMNLVIELDGGQHALEKEYDATRTAYLQQQGYRVLRFWNHEVLENAEGVYRVILSALKETPPPAPSLKGKGCVEVVLLTGSIKGHARQHILEKIADGQANIIIGTHALFQDEVEFNNLALVVIDEQHRFGVGQRMALSAKGNAPHILHMTATPIPRSLTMTLYGDMDCSLLKEKPAGRQPVATRVIPLSRYAGILERLQAALDSGEKAYWICPLIEDDSMVRLLDSSIESSNHRNIESSDLAAAQSRFTEFTARFGGRVGLVHGRMKAAERDEQMRRFASGEVRLLVATTVVEVGVDVRDATIMVIEQAERFGLSQLHQLRGRVGRGDKPSACVLLYSEGIRDSALGIREKGAVSNPQSLSPNPSLERLSIMRETEDGFKIAEADLRLRGGGDLLGMRQSGMPRFIFTDLLRHWELLEHARDDGQRILAADPALAGERGQALRILLQLFGFDME